MRLTVPQEIQPGQPATGPSCREPERIPLARPNISQAEIDAVVEVLNSPHLSFGPRLREFEEAFARYCQTEFAVACSSGTAGLHLLLHAVNIQPGDEVITTPFSFIASANCALMQGGKPVPGSRTEKFVKGVDRSIKVYLTLSGRTMEFDGNAACVKGCN